MRRRGAAASAGAAGKSFLIIQHELPAPDEPLIIIKFVNLQNGRRELPGCRLNGPSALQARRPALGIIIQQAAGSRRLGTWDFLRSAAAPASSSQHPPSFLRWPLPTGRPRPPRRPAGASGRQWGQPVACRRLVRSGRARELLLKKPRRWVSSGRPSGSSERNWIITPGAWPSA